MSHQTLSQPPSPPLPDALNALILDMTLLKSLLTSTLDIIGEIDNDMLQLIRTIAKIQSNNFERNN